MQASSQGQVADHGAQTAVFPLDQLPETNNWRVVKLESCMLQVYILWEWHEVMFCSPVGGDLNLQSHLYIQQVLVFPQQQGDLLLGYLQIQLNRLYTLLVQYNTT